MSATMYYQLFQATIETLYMVLASGLVASVMGAPLGIALITFRPDGLLPKPYVHRVLGALINAFRSIPFIILMIAVIPLTRFLVGTSIGNNAAIVPLSLAAAPFVARVVENALEEVPSSLIEAGIAMGASPLQIIIRILIPEALSGIINALTVTLIVLIGYSAMAGAVGAGGLGNLAINYGYQRFETSVIIATVVILLILVQVIQLLGSQLARYCSHL